MAKISTIVSPCNDTVTIILMFKTHIISNNNLNDNFWILTIFESREELEISPKDGFNFVNKIKTILILTMIVNVSA